MNTNLSSEDILELAISKHKKQDLFEAEKLYQDILNKDDNILHKSQKIAYRFLLK